MPLTLEENRVCVGIGKEIFLAVKRLDAAEKRWRETLEAYGIKPYRFWPELYEALKTEAISPSDAARMVEERGDLNDAERNLYGFMSSWLRRCPASKIKSTE